MNKGLLFVSGLFVTLVLGGCSQDPNLAANELYVSASKQFSTIPESKSYTQALASYTQAYNSIDDIVELYPSSDLAVQIISGQSVLKMYGSNEFQNVAKVFEKYSHVENDPFEMAAFIFMEAPGKLITNRYAPKFLEAMYQKGGIDRVMVFLDDMQWTQKESTEQLISLAERLVASGMRTNLRPLFVKAMNTNQKNDYYVSNLSRLGHIAIEIGDPEYAGKVFDAALASRPETNSLAHAEIRARTALGYARLGDFVTAKAIIDDVVSAHGRWYLEGKVSDVVENIVQTYIEMGQQNDVYELYKNLSWAELDSLLPSMDSLMMLAARSKDDVYQQVDMLTKTYGLTQGEKAGLFLKGARVLYKNGDLLAAQELYDEALEDLNGVDNLRLWNILFAEYLYELGDDSLAGEYVQRAIEYNILNPKPDSLGRMLAASNLSLMLVDMAMKDKAKEVLEGMPEETIYAYRKTGSETAGETLAAAYLAAGMIEQAIEVIPFLDQGGAITLLASISIELNAVEGGIDAKIKHKLQELFQFYAPLDQLSIFNQSL
jgi:tetratricopeptide (TPR) repeat protein